MERILKTIETWIRVEKELLAGSTGISTAESYHSGALVYLSRVVGLIEQQLSRDDEGI